MTDTQPSYSAQPHPGSAHSSPWLLSLAALGIVFGDIGTSPLYAMRECFFGSHSIAPTPAHVLAVTSLVLWAIILLVSFKYLTIVFRADNQGEGGILALTALAREAGLWRREVQGALLVLGLVGAALLYGDGAITPAISVLSAVEGLKIIAPQFDFFVVPLTVLILIFLFLIQRHGTARIGLFFGPIIFVWFLTLGALGLIQVLRRPDILLALNPLNGISLLLEGSGRVEYVLGSVFLAVTGAEALYADMGHFGKEPIRRAWYAVALPGLALNYLGQGALLLDDPSAAQNPFYLLAPRWALVPLLILATSATVIASQALITGVFSLTSQAIQLGYLPRMEILHTSSSEYGQIFIPFINRMLLLTTILLVLGFKSSANLAAAYGIAVSLTLVMTTLLVSSVMVSLWKWPFRKAVSLGLIFLGIELAFLAANSLKILHGGWVSLFLGVSLFVVMTTWRTGRTVLALRVRNQSLSFEALWGRLNEVLCRVPGVAVYLTKDPDRVPAALINNLQHNRVLHERVLLLHVRTLRTPYVDPAARLEVEELRDGFARVVLSFGFMERPHLMPALSDPAAGLGTINPDRITFFAGAETVVPVDNKRGMALWREYLFAFMLRNAERVSSYFSLPASQVVEIGVQVEF